MSKLYEAVDKAFDSKIITEETIYDSSSSNYDYLKNNMNKEDLDILVKSVAIDTLSDGRGDEAATLGADFKYTNDEIQKGIERLNILDGDKIAVYCYREFATKYNKLFGVEEGRGWDFKESESLNEERYYYSEIVSIAHMIDNGGDQLRNAYNAIEEAKDRYSDYSDNQKAFLDKAINALDDILTNLVGMHSDMIDTFPSRIRAMTPEEKEILNQMKQNGEIE